MNFFVHAKPIVVHAYVYACSACASSSAARPRPVRVSRAAGPRWMCAREHRIAVRTCCPARKTAMAGNGHRHRVRALRPQVHYLHGCPGALALPHCPCPPSGGCEPSGGGGALQRHTAYVTGVLDHINYEEDGIVRFGGGDIVGTQQTDARMATCNTYIITNRRMNINEEIEQAETMHGEGLRKLVIHGSKARSHCVWHQVSGSIGNHVAMVPQPLGHKSANVPSQLTGS
mgnify:CR=1 FL=1